MKDTLGMFRVYIILIMVMLLIASANVLEADTEGNIMSEDNVEQMFNFKKWWSEYLDAIEGYKEFHSEAMVLSTRYEELSSADKDEVLDGFVNVLKERMMGEMTAAWMLEKHAKKKHVDTIYDLLSSNDFTDEDFQAALLRVLAKHGAESQLEPVRYFLLETNPRSYFGVEWALWPRNKELWLQAKVKYFTEVPIARWEGSAVCGAFVQYPEAYLMLREPLLSDNQKAWEAFHKGVIKWYKMDLKNKVLTQQQIVEWEAIFDNKK